jgi:hypothetical protein
LGTHQKGTISIVLLNGQVREMLDVLHVLVLRKKLFLINQNLEERITFFPNLANWLQLASWKTTCTS